MEHLGVIGEEERLGVGPRVDARKAGLFLLYHVDVHKAILVSIITQGVTLVISILSEVYNENSRVYIRWGLLTLYGQLYLVF